MKYILKKQPSNNVSQEIWCETTNLQKNELTCQLFFNVSLDYNNNIDNDNNLTRIRSTNINHGIAQSLQEYATLSVLIDL